MRFGIRTLDEFTVRGKVVLCRVDINEPVDRERGELRDTTRIEACAPTIKELSDKGARVVVLAHQGSDIEYKNFYTTRSHARVLQKLLNREVRFIDDVCGPAAREAIRSLRDREILMLDNVRYVSEEQTLFEQKLGLTHAEQAGTLVVRKLAPLADLYVCDAFAAAHRDQPSLCGFEQVLPSAMGRLFEKEYCVIAGLTERPERPCVFVLGGAKIGDAFLMMRNVLEQGVADRVLTGGLVGEVLLWADGQEIGGEARALIGKLGYEALVEPGRALLAAHRERIALPVDLAYTINGGRRGCEAGRVPASVLVDDIGSETAAVYRKAIMEAKTVFVNGPMGVFEKTESELGTRAVWDALGETAAYTVVGGGDSIAATNKYGKAGKIGYICTGGGALIRFLSGEELPVVKALRYGAALAEKRL